MIKLNNKDVAFGEFPNGEQYLPIKELEIRELNTVFFTYESDSDIFGFAIKSTACVVDGQERMIFKDPVTDDGTKKSMKGVVAVQHDGYGSIMGIDELTLNHTKDDLLQDTFVDGKLLIDEPLSTIRQRLADWEE